MFKRIFIIGAILLMYSVLIIACSTAPTQPTAVQAPTETLTPLPSSTPSPVPTSTQSPTSTSSPIPPTPTIALSNCQACHQEIFADWRSGAHANTQADVAKEIGEARSGQSPNDVINGPDAEDCIACHAPNAITVAHVTNEVEALNYFFSTADGKFITDTQALHTSDWPHLSCPTCHNVTDNHQTAKLAFGIFNSQISQFVSLTDSSQVCGQCHGNLLIASTDHQTYNAWATSKHAATQADVAKELVENRSGQTPQDVITGQDSENCIACHAPTAVLANGGMTETLALDYFFTTTGGVFTSTTTINHASEWPNVSCTACHDPHNPGTPAYFNSETKTYQPMKDTSQLCGQCHGNLRFPNTDHLSYNIIAGTGGKGVPDQQMTPNVACTDCHMYVSNVDGSNSTMLGGHTWAISVKEADGTSTTSCIKCHPDWTTTSSEEKIKKLQSDFQTLDAQVTDVMDKATQAMQGSTNADLQSKLEEAQYNLSFAESDESGGFHNNTYLMALLDDAQQKAQEVLTALGK
jgi:formate-dependent nitrite reductase cytochrome c552 subunit